METREFPTAVIASLSSGVLLCKFDEMHQAAEYLMGHPIWTHHFASKDLWRSMQKSILDQCPGMPTSLTAVTHDNAREHIAQIEAEIGPRVTIRKGDGKTAMHPLDGIPPGKRTIVIRSSNAHLPPRPWYAPPYC